VCIICALMGLPCAQVLGIAAALYHRRVSRAAAPATYSAFL
jgi:hypothetical protein